MQRHFIKIAKISLVLVYLVIIAGAVVRMTGSGMGCPDWPKCFGYYIPPTDIEQLIWKSNHNYKSGQVIILNESLFVAKENFSSGTILDSINWEVYSKHDYAVFNASHTWIEFINRLVGALAGIATLITAIISITFWKQNKKITLISWFIFFCMGFQAWLGATVVYSLLAPVKISIHMLMALLIVALLIYLIHYSSHKKTRALLSRLEFRLLGLAFGLTIIQIVFGIQVRQFIDEQGELLGLDLKAFFLQDPIWSFYVHRSLSILVFLVNIFLARSIFKKAPGYPQMKWILLLLFMEIGTGILMYYMAFPFGSQPLHLIFAALLFGIQFHFVLEARERQNTGISL